MQEGDRTLRHKTPKRCMTSGGKLEPKFFLGKLERYELKVKVVCSCGITKEYYEADIDNYTFVCNGLVILKYATTNRITSDLN
jgi:hypothetical protein